LHHVLSLNGINKDERDSVNERYEVLMQWINGMSDDSGSFVRRQHARFSPKQVFASSCLHIEHIHTCVVMLVSVLIFFWCFEFASTYNHSATSGTPIMKKTIIVRIRIVSTNNEIPQQSVPIPSIESQRVVVSILSPALVYVTVFLFSSFCT
jgi:hypothetical protein